MNLSDIEKEIDSINKKIEDLDLRSIGAVMEPTTGLYLENFINPLITKALETLPTTTYSAGAPTGTAPTGSVWYEDTGVLATRKIHVYSGSAWIQFK